MRILACQIHIPQIVSKTEKTKHLKSVSEKIEVHLSKSRTKTDLVVLPELSSISYSRNAFNRLDKLAEKLDGESFEIFSQLAAAHSVYISYGIPRIENSKYFISQVIVGPEGKYVGYYDKLHIAHFGNSIEKDYFQAGNHLLVFDVNEIRVAQIICYDFRFADLLKTVCVSKHADLVIHSVAFYNDGSYPSWHNFVVTRALEHQVYFLSLNRAGENYGSSIFCPPWIDHYTKCIQMPKSETFEFFEVNMDAINLARATYPLKLDVRDDYDLLPSL